MGHIGLTPQSVHKMGGYVVQGRDEDTARKLLDDAVALEAGRLLRAGARGRAARAGRRHHRAADHPHHRHRRRQALRWPGAGLLRPAGPEPRLQAQVRQALRQPVRVDRRRGAGRSSTRCGRATFPDEEHSFRSTPCGWSPSNPDVAAAEREEKGGVVRRPGLSAAVRPLYVVLTTPAEVRSLRRPASAPLGQAPGAGAHHGLPARGAPVADARGHAARRRGGRLHLRQPDPVRPHGGPLALPARSRGRPRRSARAAGVSLRLRARAGRRVPAGLPDLREVDEAVDRGCAARAGRATSGAWPPWWPSCSRCSGPTWRCSARRTTSSCRSSSRLTAISSWAWRSSACPPCASPTGWRCRRATPTSRRTSGSGRWRCRRALFAAQRLAQRASETRRGWSTGCARELTAADAARGLRRSWARRHARAPLDRWSRGCPARMLVAAFARQDPPHRQLVSWSGR